VERNTSTTIVQVKQWPRRSYSNGSRYSERTLLVRHADIICRRAQEYERELIPLLTKWGKDGPTFEQINDLINECAHVAGLPACC
jgi:hypothetical protein